MENNTQQEPQGRYSQQADGRYYVRHTASGYGVWCFNEDGFRLVKMYGPREKGLIAASNHLARLDAARDAAKGTA